MATKTVSLRVEEAALERIERAGLSPTEIMRDALYQKDRELRLDAWIEKVRALPRFDVPPGSPTSTEIIRQMRDERYGDAAADTEER